MFAAANLQIRPLPLSLIVESGDSTQRFYYAHTFIESALNHLVFLHDLLRNHVEAEGHQ
jgi:hypothetical protein